MHEIGNIVQSKYLFTLIPAFPSIFFGIYLIWLQQVSLSNSSIVIVVLLMILLSCVGGYLLWLLHIDQLNRHRNFYQQKNRAAMNKLKAYTSELERLLLMVTPKVFEQTLAARELTEQEISILIRRFSAMLAELEQIFDFVNHVSKQQMPDEVENLKSNAEKIRGEIDVVLEALQFQDRVSQILTQVQDNVMLLRKTVENIQSQGNDRSQSMINVEETLLTIERNYDSVNQPPKRLLNEHESDELTFF